MIAPQLTLDNLLPPLDLKLDIMCFIELQRDPYIIKVLFPFSRFTSNVSQFSPRYFYCLWSYIITSFIIIIINILLAYYYYYYYS